MKKLTSGFVLLVLLATASSASGFDGYKDRRGWLLGVGIGGGVGGVDVDRVGDVTGMDENVVSGLHADLSIGAGITQDLVARVEGNMWLRNVQLNDFQLNHKHFSVLPTLDYFLIDGLHVSGGAGLAYAAFDTLRDERETYRYQEMGFATKLGVGYEFFANGTIAAGAQVGYTKHFYSNGGFDTLTGGLTIRWY